MGCDKFETLHPVLLIEQPNWYEFREGNIKEAEHMTVGVSNTNAHVVWCWWFGLVTTDASSSPSLLSFSSLDLIYVPYHSASAWSTQRIRAGMFHNRRRSGNYMGDKCFSR